MVDPVFDLSATGDDGFVPPPVVKRSTIIAIGFALFFLALIWPPLLLMVTYVLSILVPVSIISVACAFQSLCTLLTTRSLVSIRGASMMIPLRGDDCLKNFENELTCQRLID